MLQDILPAAVLISSVQGSAPVYFLNEILGLTDYAHKTLSGILILVAQSGYLGTSDSDFG